MGNSILARLSESDNKDSNKSNFVPSRNNNKITCKRCPNCGLHVERICGSDDMPCRGCGVTWCWVCLEYPCSNIVCRNPCAGTKT